RPALPTLFPYTTLFRSQFFETGRVHRRALRVYRGSAEPDGVDARRPAPPALSAVGPAAGDEIQRRILSGAARGRGAVFAGGEGTDRKSTRLNSSHVKIS